MQTQTYENAGDELHAKIEQYMDKVGCSYAEAMRRVTGDHPDLARRYARGESESAPDPEDKKGAAEFSMRVENYAAHFQISRAEAERRVRAHDPKMQKYSRQGGQIVMDTGKIPLSAESVVDVRAQELMAKGEIKSYSEAMRVVLAEDQLLAECYRAGKPYLEASAARAYQDEMPNVTAKSQLGVLISGARKSDNSPDVELMLRVANLTPGLVRGAASERLGELANAITGKPGMPQGRVEAYPIALRQVRQEHPELVAASESGVLNETALREIFYPWFTERD